MKGSKRKKYVKRACKPCIAAKRSCSEVRPCDRCIRLSRTAECICDGPTEGDEWQQAQRGNEFGDSPTFGGGDALDAAFGGLPGDNGAAALLRMGDARGESFDDGNDVDGFGGDGGGGAAFVGGDFGDYGLHDGAGTHLATDRAGDAAALAARPHSTDGLAHFAARHADVDASDVDMHAPPPDASGGDGGGAWGAAPVHAPPSDASAATPAPPATLPAPAPQQSPAAADGDTPGGGARALLADALAAAGTLLATSSARLAAAERVLAGLLVAHAVGQRGDAVRSLVAAGVASAAAGGHPNPPPLAAATAVAVGALLRPLLETPENAAPPVFDVAALASLSRAARAQASAGGASGSGDDALLQALAQAADACGAATAGVRETAAAEAALSVAVGSFTLGSVARPASLQATSAS